MLTHPCNRENNENTTIHRKYADRREMGMADFQFEIIETIGVLSESPKGWKKELNRVSWNGGAPKYDIRDWAPDHEKMGKGVTLSDEELQALKGLIAGIGD